MGPLSDIDKKKHFKVGRHVQLRESPAVEGKIIKVNQNQCQVDWKPLHKSQLNDSHEQTWFADGKLNIFISNDDLDKLSRNDNVLSPNRRGSSYGNGTNVSKVGQRESKNRMESVPTSPTLLPRSSSPTSPASSQQSYKSAVIGKVQSEEKQATVGKDKQNHAAPEEEQQQEEVRQV